MGCLYQTIMSNYRNIVGNDIKNYVPLRSQFDPILKCNTTVEMLGSCFNSNNCFSQQEMDLVRDVVFTIYHMGMTQLAKFVSHFKDLLSSESPEVLGQIKPIAKCFETEHYKIKIESSPATLLSSASQLLSKIPAIMATVLCIMLNLLHNRCFYPPQIQSYLLINLPWICLICYVKLNHSC